MEHKRLIQDTRFLRRELSREADGPGLLGQSHVMRQVRELIGKVATTRSTALITGESGTGKELVARSIHAQSAAASEPFIPINCAGIPDHLMESELFGHTQGAFTGAHCDREGFFELAGKGTILLDELGEMPLALQSKLLRVVEDRSFTRVGGRRPISFDARLMASTNRDLDKLVAEGQFRQDLYFRFAVFEIHVPPLREHRDDIPMLCEHLVGKLNRELKRTCLGVKQEAMKSMMSYTWPGNVRELRNVLERAMILTTSSHISPADLLLQVTGAEESPQHGDDLRAAMAFYEKQHIQRILQTNGGNKEQSARHLGINPSTLYRKMADLGLTTGPAPETAT